VITFLKHKVKGQGHLVNTLTLSQGQCVAIRLRVPSRLIHQEVSEAENYNSVCKLPTGWAKLNGANAVSFVVVKLVLESFDNFWQLK